MNKELITADGAKWPAAKEAETAPAGSGWWSSVVVPAWRGYVRWCMKAEEAPNPVAWRRTQSKERR